MAGSTGVDTYCCHLARIRDQLDGILAPRLRQLRSQFQQKLHSVPDDLMLFFFQVRGILHFIDFPQIIDQTSGFCMDRETAGIDKKSFVVVQLTPLHLPLE